MVNTLISLCLFIRNILYRHLLLKIFFKKMGQSRPLFVYFRSFLITISIQIEKSVDGVLGIRTQSRRMVGADETTELWRPPLLKIFVIDSFKYPQHLKVPTPHQSGANFVVSPKIWDQKVCFFCAYVSHAPRKV